MQTKVLRFFRAAKNLPQKAIADVLGKSQPYYSDLENGVSKLSNDDAEKLAVFYGVSAGLFLNDKQPILNNNIGEHSKSINNTENYTEAGKELMQPVLEKVDKLLQLLAEEKKELAAERKQIFELLNKLADKLGK
jgi:transcriptional regulator with XRE-family HTH domain